MMEYPEKLIRGISSKNFIDSEGRLSTQAFQFMPSNDHLGFDEASISWYDNEDALRITWEQKKDGDKESFQFKAGVAILSRQLMDSVFSKPNVIGMLTYERKPTNANPYHGNLLRKHGLPSWINNFIGSTIALVCLEKIITRD